MTELVELRGDAQSQLVAWADAARAAAGLATSLVATNVCPPAFRGKPAEATAVILLGAELGLSPIAALRSMFEIRGTLGMYVQAQVALVQSRGHRIWTAHETDDAVTVAGHRAGDPDHVEESTWTIERARRAGFIRRGARNEPSQYELQPRTMLRARAAGEIARRIAADVLAGVPELDDPQDSSQALTAAHSASGTVVQRRRPAQPAPVDVTELDEQLPAELPPAVEDAPPQQESLDDGGASPDTLPIEDEPNEDDEPLMTPAQLRQTQVLLVQAGIRGSDARHAWLSRFLGRQVEASNAITVTEASAVIDELLRVVEQLGVGRDA